MISIMNNSCFSLRTLKYKLNLKMSNNGSNSTGSTQIPGKIIFSEDQLREREQKLRILSEQWKIERVEKEKLENRTFGFSKNSEILNGRLAMFFFTTGLLTEYWTKQNLVQQIETGLRILGIF